MLDNTLKVIIISVMATLLLLIILLFLASVSRRVNNKRKYQKLDDLRARFNTKLRESLASGDLLNTQRDFIAVPKSDDWQAIEDVLLRLVSEEQYERGVTKLFSSLGYVPFYEKQLESRNIQVCALGIDKLGRMKSEASLPKIIALLDNEHPELVFVAVRSLSRIGGPVALQAIVDRMSFMLDRSIVSRKSMGMALQSFGADAIPLLVAQNAGKDNPWVISCILDILSRLPADPRSVKLAEEHIASANAEVRCKVLKVLGRPETVRGDKNPRALILPLLADPIWFVRLQAIRSIRALGHNGDAAPIGKLLGDQNWQVRNEAAQALIALGGQSLDILCDILTGADKYAKESICEEIEKMNFSGWLIGNLKARDRYLREKSRRILEIMHALGFSTPHHEYLEQEGDASVKELIRTMMKTGSAA